MELFPLDGNPVPDGSVVGAITTSDGVALRYARWPATVRRSLGTICIFEGRGETIERYFEVVDDLRKRGFAVAILDWRGQGGSERRLKNGRKGHVDSFEEYDRDLDAFMHQVALPDCPPPHYALAHSTGGLVCLRAAHDGRTRFTRMVLSAPLLGLGARRPSQPTVYSLSAIITALGLGEIDLPGRRVTAIERMKFENNPLTSDPARFARNRELSARLPQISLGVPTFGWLYAACRAMAEAADAAFAPAINVPILMVAGSVDRVVSVEAIEGFAGELRGGSLLVIPGGRHEIMMERDRLREQFYAAFDAFIPGS